MGFVEEYLNIAVGLVVGLFVVEALPWAKVHDRTTYLWLVRLQGSRLVMCEFGLRAKERGDSGVGRVD